MVFAVSAHGLAVAHLVAEVDVVAGIVDGEAVAAQNLAVGFGMQVGEAGGEVEGVAVDKDGAVGALALCAEFGGHVLGVDAEEPAYAGAFQLQKAGGDGGGEVMHHQFAHFPKDVGQHVEKVYADVGGDAARFFHIAFPGVVVPLPPSGDVGQVDVVNFIFRAVVDACFELLHGGVEAQLENVVDFLAGIFFDVGEAVEVPRIEHERFFADGIGTVAQGKADMGVVQVVG